MKYVRAIAAAVILASVVVIGGAIGLTIVALAFAVWLSGLVVWACIAGGVLAYEIAKGVSRDANDGHELADIDIATRPKQGKFGH